DRNEGGLVLLEQKALLSARDARGAGDHDPMLGAMMMQLQREHATGSHHQALDLEALAIVDAVVAAPGPKHLAMQGVLVTSLGLQAAHQRLDVLHAALGHHE